MLISLYRQRITIVCNFGHVISVFCCFSPTKELFFNFHGPEYLEFRSFGYCSCWSSKQCNEEEGSRIMPIFYEIAVQLAFKGSPCHLGVGLIISFRVAKYLYH